MQIVDEADETETINRPSFFDALQLKISTKPGKVTKQNNNASTNSPFKTTQGIRFGGKDASSYEDSTPQKLSKSPSKTH